MHTPVIAQLSSKDVIHSFSLPVMRVKQDMIPGMGIQFTHLTPEHEQSIKKFILSREPLFYDDF